MSMMVPVIGEVPWAKRVRLFWRGFSGRRAASSIGAMQREPAPSDQDDAR